ncbi:MAG: PAS domain S-box protein [Methanosarcinaceae archaeon]
MRKNLRESGIDVAGDIPWGTHFCQFYQAEEELMEIIGPYFQAGLENNEFCVWVAPQFSEEEAKEALRRDIPDIDAYLEQGQIEIIPSDHVYVNAYANDNVNDHVNDNVNAYSKDHVNDYAKNYLNEDIPCSKKELNGWIEKINRALSRGYDGLRLGGNAFWLEKMALSEFADCEEELDSKIGNHRMIALCTYPLDSYSTTGTVDVVVNHQFVLLKKEGKWERIESLRRKRSEEKIRNLANIVESSTDAIVTKSPDGLITSWNKGAEQIYGYSAEEILGKPMSILEPHTLLGETKKLAELIEHGDNIRNHETLRLRKDGRIINVSLTLSPIFGATGKLTSISVIARDITKRKKAEEKLQESEERFRTATEQTGQIIFDFKLDTREVNWAGAIREVTGYAREEFENFGDAAWLEHVHPEDRGEIFENLMTVFKERNKIQAEYRFRKKDGSYIYMEIRGVWLKDERGKLYRAIGVMKDINEMKLSQEMLSRSEKRYRLVTEQTGQLVYDFDLITDEGSWAGAIEEITGYTEEEFRDKGRTFWVENIHPADRERVAEDFIEVRKSGKRYRVEFRFRKKDGTYAYLENNGVYLTDKSGFPVRSLGAVRDITERKISEEKIQESERKYRSFIQNFHGIAFQADEHFIPIFLHGAVEEITGYSEEEFMSRVRWKDIIHPEDLPLIYAEEEKIQDSPKPGYGEIDFRIIRKDGKIGWVHEVYQKIQREEGVPELYQGTIYDVTERKETEKFLANIETARKKEIHHRIKNNLQVISSLLDLQAEKFKNKEYVKDSEILEAFKENQDRVISIALIHEELYEGEGTDTLNFSVYLQRLVENLFQTYKFENASASLNLNLEENIFLDMDTAVPLGIIINELVSNSLKHAFANRDNGEIQIKLHREKSRESNENRPGSNKKGLKETTYTLEVSDNGIGIPESIDLENTESLGIQLVTTLVDQLEGEIELKRNKGTEFIIKFTAA